MGGGRPCPRSILMGAHRHHPKGSARDRSPAVVAPPPLPAPAGALFSCSYSSPPSVYVIAGSHRLIHELTWVVCGELEISVQVSGRVWGEMISSISLFGSSQLPALKFYGKCLPNNPHFAVTMHSVAKSTGKAMIIKRVRLKPHAMDIQRNPQAHELYKLVCRLPENLSWLLETPEIPRRIASKKKKQMDGMVTGQFGVILEWEGVVVEDDDPDLEPRVWYVLSLEEAKSFPPDALLKEIEGMRADQAISEVLCWSEDPGEIKRLAARKEVIYQILRGGYYQLRPGVLDFLNTLVDFEIPIAIAAPRSRKSLEEGIKTVGLQGYFDAIIALEDFCLGKPDGEMFEVAAEQLGLEPDVCVVFGNSNLTTECAHTAGMWCVAVAGRHPAYELHAANHVVRWLDQLSVVDLKRLVNGEVIGRRGRESDMDMEIVIEE